jgi:glycosyltransferase involved in cell wall biosynthesis
MDVYYSHDIFSSQEFGGISRYYVELIRQLLDRPNAASPKVLAGLYINGYLKGLNKGVKGQKVPLIPHTLFLRLFLNERFQNAFLSSRSDGVFHQTYFFEKPKKRKQRLVITIHDMIHERFTNYFKPNDKFSTLKKQFCEEASQIICVSQHTKNDLLTYYKLDPQKVSVIYHGRPTSHFQGHTSAQSPRPYILYVGSRYGYKNFSAVLQIFSLSEKLKKSFDLICFGGGQLNSEERQLINNLKLKDSVHVVSGDDSLLEQFYRGARAFIYPSLYEGFGIPLLEAMTYECPVFCSNSSSLPEVAGDAAFYFDAKSVESMRSLLEENIFLDSKLSEMKDKGRRQVEKFSWMRAADETMAVYKNA